MYPFQSISSALYNSYSSHSYMDLLLSEDELLDGFTDPVQNAVSIAPTYNGVSMEQNQPINPLIHPVQPAEKPFMEFMGDVQNAVSITPSYGVSIEENQPINSMTHSLYPDENSSYEFSAQSTVSIAPINYGVLLQQNQPTNFMTDSVQLNQEFSAQEKLMTNPQFYTYHRASHQQYMDDPMNLMTDTVQQSQDFFGNKSLMMNTQVSMYHQTGHDQYMNDQVMPQIFAQLEPQEPALQPQQPEMQIAIGDQLLNVELEPPFMPEGKPRLRWTAALHARFLGAAMELGGIHNATPKGILVNMNVRGITIDQVKSHLQKVRIRNNQGIPLEEFLAYGIQADGGDGGAANGGGGGGRRNARRRHGANVQPVLYEAPGPQGLLGAYEAPNHLQNQNPTMGPMVNALNNFNFPNF